MSKYGFKLHSLAWLKVQCLLLLLLSILLSKGSWPKGIVLLVVLGSVGLAHLTKINLPKPFYGMGLLSLFSLWIMTATGSISSESLSLCVVLLAMLSLLSTLQSSLGIGLLLMCNITLVTLNFQPINLWDFPVHILWGMLFISILIRALLGLQAVYPMYWFIRVVWGTIGIGLLFWLILPRYSPTNVVVVKKKSVKLAVPDGKHEKAELLDDDDTISLRGLQKIKRIREKVFEYQISTVDSQGDPFRSSPSYYFRNQIFTRYQEGIWFADTGRESIRFDDEDRQKDGWTQVSSIVRSPYIECQIWPTMPMRSYLSFGLTQAYATESLSINLNGSISRHDDEYYKPYQFKSCVERPWPGAEILYDGGFPDSRCLEVPQHLREVLTSLVSLPDPNLQDRVRLKSIRNQLRACYTYTLEIEGQGSEPLLDLQKEKKGWCVHFATAMVLLARMNGLPARVASGYSVSGDIDENGIGTAYLSDAHAWAEVWLKDVGWTLWEATPSEGVLSSMPNHSEADTWDAKNKTLLMRGFYLSALWRWTLLGVTLFGVFVLWRRRQLEEKLNIQESVNRQHQHQNQRSKHIGLWEELNSILEGNEKCGKHETEAQHAARLKVIYPEIEIDRLLALHKAERWGGLSISEADDLWSQQECQRLRDVVLCVNSEI